MIENINSSENINKKTFLEYSEEERKKFIDIIREKHNSNISLTEEESDFWEANKDFFDDDDQPYHYHHSKHH